MFKLFFLPIYVTKHVKRFNWCFKTKCCVIYKTSLIFENISFRLFNMFKKSCIRKELSYERRKLEVTLKTCWKKLNYYFINYEVDIF